jgi:ABC-2 type transport system permease protein
MTTTITQAPAAVPGYAAEARLSQARVVRSEWTKLRSLPSTAWSLLATTGLIVGLGAAYALVRVTRPPRQPSAAGFDPTAISLTGVQLAQLAIGILGVLLITGEYATGMIRGSITAVPSRLPLLGGKAIAFALTTLALCVPATLAAFLVGQSILGTEHLDTTLAHPGAARAVLGAALYLTAVGLLGLGLGALLRNTTAAIAALFGLLFGLQLLSGLLPSAWADHAYKYLPTPAGTAITTMQPGPDSLAPWTGLGVFCLYAAATLALAAWRLRRLDV